MALMKCHDCGGQVSDYARTCPHCGVPIIATIQRRPKVVVMDLAIRLVLGLFLGHLAWLAIRHIFH